MESPDLQVKGNGANILLVVIMSITCINILLIYKVLFEARRRAHGYNRAKHLVVILQACGDIFVALFPLIIRYQGLVDNPPMVDVVCWHRILAHTFLFHLMPFVHATGIILLTAESFLFWGQYGIHPTFLSHGSWFSRQNFLASLIPWVLGALAVFPLVLVGFDFDFCTVADYSMPRIASFYWITIILPGVVAFMTSYAYMVIPGLNKSYHAQLSFASFTDHPSAHSSDCFENDLPTYNEACQTNKEKVDIMKASRANFGISNGGKHREEFREYGKPLADYSLPERDELLRTEDGNRTQNSLLQAEDISSKICWEKRSRFIAAFIFCVCSMPCAVLDLIILSGNSENMGPKTAQIATGLESLYRLHVLRSLISPLVWINEYS